MSQQQAVPKPSLQGVRIKARKGAVKAQAKHEPTGEFEIFQGLCIGNDAYGWGVFRDQLYKHLETVPEGDFDSFTSKLVQAGSTLEYLKYADALFEILLVGGLLQPGGSYVDDGAPPSPFSILQAKEPAEVDDMKKYVDVLNKLIRRYASGFASLFNCTANPPLRYKYLQKPLQESALPGLLQYANRWPQSQQDKFAIASGLLLSQGLASGGALLSLTKDHLVKNGPHHHILIHASFLSLVIFRCLLEHCHTHFPYISSRPVHGSPRWYTQERWH